LAQPIRGVGAKARAGADIKEFCRREEAEAAVLHEIRHIVFGNTEATVYLRHHVDHRQMTFYQAMATDANLFFGTLPAGTLDVCR
jgi:hypothetical protein